MIIGDHQSQKKIIHVLDAQGHMLYWMSSASSLLTAHTTTTTGFPLI